MGYKVPIASLRTSQARRYINSSALLLNPDPCFASCAVCVFLCLLLSSCSCRLHLIFYYTYLSRAHTITSPIPHITYPTYTCFWTQPDLLGFSTRKRNKRVGGFRGVAHRRLLKDGVMLPMMHSTQTWTVQRVLSRTHATLLFIPMTHSVTYSRWTHSGAHGRP
jgi:hypothetical protein